MKHVKDKKITFVSQELNKEKTALVDAIKETSYFNEIIACCKKPSVANEAFSYDDIKNNDAVKKAIDSAKKGVAAFEDAIFSFVQKQVASQKWNIPDMQFVQFMDYIKDIKD